MLQMANAINEDIGRKHKYIKRIHASIYVFHLHLPRKNKKTFTSG